MIHKTAIISSNNVNIHDDVQIGPYSIIGDDVHISSGTSIGAHVIIEGPTEIGRNNRIFHHCSMGTEPQDITYKKEKTRLIIGDNNVFREFCYINRGTVNGKGFTKIGSNNYLMGYVHVAHDCVLKDFIIIANATNLGGHVEIDSYSFIGGLCGIHQFCRVGAYTMVGGASAVTEDVLPYSIVFGNRAKTANINLIGLERNKIPRKEISNIKHAFDQIYSDKFNVTEALRRLREQYPDSEEIKYLIEFIEKSKRGIAGHA